MRTIIALEATLLTTECLSAAEPDWTSIEKHALDLLQQYIRIASVNPVRQGTAHNASQTTRTWIMLRAIGKAMALPATGKQKVNVIPSVGEATLDCRLRLALTATGFSRRSRPASTIRA